MRAFLAVELNDDLRRRVAVIQEQLKASIADSLSRRIRVTWVRPDAMHLTVAFFATLDESIAPELRDGVGRAVEALDPFAVPLSRVGAFPRPAAPRTIWLGPSRDWEHGPEVKSTAALAGAVNAVCVTLGLPIEDRPWHPHLTLARVRDGEREMGKVLSAGVWTDPAETGAVDVREIALMRSDLQPAGPLYTKLWSVGLR